jgi:hypothetical protein
MTDLAHVALHRCPGWRHKGYEGHAAHTLPATPEYFWADQYKPSGLNHQCKECNRAYSKHSRKVWNEERARRKQRNEIVAAPIWAKVAM